MKKIFFGFLIVLLIILALFLPGFLIKNKKLKMGGSTSAYPLFYKLEAFAKAKEIDFIYNSQGSSAGYNNVMNDNFILGFISKEPNSRIKKAIAEKKLQKFLFVKDRIIFVYYLPSECTFKNPIQKQLNLTKASLQKVFFSKVAYWDFFSDLKCSTRKKIQRINRETGSGTKTVFKNKFLEMRDKNKHKTVYDEARKKSSGLILRSFDKPSGAGQLTYISYFYRKKLQNIHHQNQKINFAKIDGLNVDHLQYPFIRNFWGLFLRKNRTKLQKFFKFLQLPSTVVKINKIGFVYQFKLKDD